MFLKTLETVIQRFLQPWRLSSLKPSFFLKPWRLSSETIEPKSRRATGEGNLAILAPSDGKASPTRSRSFASPARTHDTNTKRNRNRFPGWGQPKLISPQPPIYLYIYIYTYTTTLRVIRRLRGWGRRALEAQQNDASWMKQTPSPNPTYTQGAKVRLLELEGPELTKNFSVAPSCWNSLVTSAAKVICWDQLLRLSVVISCWVICCEQLLRSSVQINCWDYLLRSSAEFNCWDYLLRLAAEIICRDQLLRLAVEFSCWDYLLRLYVGIKCWDYLLSSTVELTCWDDLLRSAADMIND